MMLHMGTRCGETRKIEWRHIDLKKKTLTLIDPKNRTDCTLPIPSPLIKPFRELKKLTGKRPFVFPDARGKKPMTRPSKVLNKLVAVSGVEFSPHDLRRTFATIAEAQSIPLTTIKRLMNHKSADSDVTGGYIRTELNTLREATEKISAFILAAVDETQAMATR
jgi:integrase